MQEGILSTDFCRELVTGDECSVRSTRLGAMLKGHTPSIEDSVAGRGFGQQQGVGVGTRMGIAAAGQRLQEYTRDTFKNLRYAVGDELIWI
jgi:hypothetical protein